jgi:hypothetical protein
LNQQELGDLERYKSKGIKTFVYDPTSFYSGEKMQDLETHQDAGGLIPRPSGVFKGSGEYENVMIDFENNKIYLRKGKTYLQDPRTAIVLESLLNSYPFMENFQVTNYIFPGDRWNQKPIENYGTLKDLVSKIKQVKFKTSVYNRDPDKDLEFQEFELRVLQTVEDIDWFHATRKSNLKSIKRHGLLPKTQGKGWTVLNIDIQKAVYLTADINYARSIAETLAGRFEENAVILRISGRALKDTTKLVIDEDTLRDEMDGTVHSGKEIGMPTYLLSVLDDIGSLGYKGVIPSSFISVEEEIQSPENQDGGL